MEWGSVVGLSLHQFRAEREPSATCQSNRISFEFENNSRSTVTTVTHIALQVATKYEDNLSSKVGKMVEHLGNRTN